MNDDRRRCRRVTGYRGVKVRKRQQLNLACSCLEASKYHLTSDPTLLPVTSPSPFTMSHHRRRRQAPAPVQVIADPEGDAPSLSVTMLGAGQEVGRSCCVIQHRGKTIVCDAGLHPAYPGLGGLPFIDELDWSTVDAILITQ